jgi:hypothetical protein
LKSNGGKASPCFRPFWIGKLSDECLAIRFYYEFRALARYLKKIRVQCKVQQLRAEYKKTYD